MLTVPVPGLPTPQVALTEGTELGGSTVIPIDLRGLGQGVLPLLIPPTFDRASVLEAIALAVPQLRPAIEDPLSGHRLQLQDAQGQVWDNLPPRLSVIQWLTLSYAPVPEGHLDPLSLEEAYGEATNDEAGLLQLSADTVVQAPRPDGDADVGLPPSLLGKLTPSGTGLPCPNQVRIVPDYLSRSAALHRELVQLSWGGKEGEETTHFTVFDTLHQVRVLPRDTKDSLQICVGRALQATQATISRIRVLTAPVPGFPLPQLVLHQADHVEPLDTLVWDLRPIQQPVRTVALPKGHDLEAAFQQVVQPLPQAPALLESWRNGRVVLVDALGMLEDFLPLDFEETQHVRAEVALFQGLTQSVLDPSSWQPVPGSLTSTSTTTAMLVNYPHYPSRPPRHSVAEIHSLEVTIVRGRHCEQAVIQLPCLQIDGAISGLLRRVETATGPLQPTARLMLAKAQPSSTTPAHETVFVVLEDHSGVWSVFDTRHLARAGSLIVARSVHDLPCHAAMTPACYQNGWTLFVNGAPIHLCPRGIDDGDFVQPTMQSGFPLSVPTSVILEACPMLEAYTWGLPIPIVRNARLRRARLGFYRHAEGRCLVFGPCHAPAAFRTRHAYVPDHTEMREAVNELQDFPGRLCSIAYSEAQFRHERCTSVFASSARHSSLATLLLPAYGWPGHYVILLAPQNAPGLGALPIGHNFRIIPERRWHHGRVLRLCLDEPRLPPPAAPPAAPQAAQPAAPQPAQPQQPAIRPDPEVDDEEMAPRADPAEPESMSLLQLDARIHSHGSKDAASPVPRAATSLAYPLVGKPATSIAVLSESAGPTVPDCAAPPEPPQVYIATAISDTGSHISTPSGRYLVRDSEGPATNGSAIPTPLGRRRLCQGDAPPSTTACHAGGRNTLIEQGPPDAVSELTRHDAQSTPEPPQPATPAGTVQLSLADLVPPSQPAITWGVNQDILLHCFEDHDLHQFAQPPEVYRTVDASLLRLWHQLPAWQPELQCEELFIFTDGSFFDGAPQATWAVVIVALQAGQIVRVGTRAGVAQGPANHGPMHARQPSAFDGEIEAILHAFAVVANVPCRAAHVGADSEAALTVAQGLAATAEWDLTARATVSVRALVAMQSKGLYLHKVLAHAGCALNGLADGLAKAVGRNLSLEATGTFQTLWSAIAEGVVDHLWLVPPHPHTAYSLPPLNDAGTWDRAYCEIVAPDDLQRPFCMPEPDVVAKPVPLDLRVLQYNALSLKAPGAPELLARGLRKHAVDIAGLQETRQRQTGITTISDYWVLHAPCTDQGIGGAQIWVRHNPRWDRQAFTIVHQEPQILVVLGSFDGVRMLLVSAHAPPATTAADVIQDWWGTWRLPSIEHPPIVFRSSSWMQMQRSAGSPWFRALSSARPFATMRRACSNLRLHGRLGSAHSFWPTGYRKLIDYIGMPAEWEHTCTVQETPRLGDLYEDVDHQPVFLRLEATVDATPVQHRNQIDCRFWTIPESSQAVTTVAQYSPPVPWTTRTTAHVDALQQHLYHGVKSCIPAISPKPRNPALTPDTLAKVRLQRHLRRCTRHAQQASRRAFLHMCLRAWAQQGRPVSSVIRAEENARICAAARWARQYRQGKELRRSMWTDKAEFTRRAIVQARADGPAQFSHRLRAILRTGRRYRAPALLPCLTEEPGRPMDKNQVMDSFGRFFATAERAEPMAIEGLVRQRTGEPAACQTLQGSDLPSLAGLASGFASLRTGRAAGLSGIPSEAYRACPLQQALLYYPVACKLFIRDPSPFQWKGGLATCVPKPGKPCTQHKGYRAIMLLEGDNKALQKCMRPSLLKAMPYLGVPDQMGGRPGYALTQPSACVKAHLHRLRRTRQSGAVIFIDAAAAYYSIAKDLLSLTPAQRRDRTYLESRATRLFQFEDLRQQFVQRMLDSNAELDEAMSPALRAYLQRQLDQTWYVPRHDSPIAYVAGSGTAPGSPLADVMFSLVFGDLLRQTQAFLREQGWHSRLTAQATNSPGYTPTWADDVCILVEVGPAELVPTATAATLSFFLDRMHGAGLQANMGLGKTETILALHGSGSREVRRQLFCQTDPQLPYSSKYERGHVRITATYDHQTIWDRPSKPTATPFPPFGAAES
ncbi:X-element\ORF2 [Symbiodinium sp. CCMP2592]|nr:X-element\ORF2 [Symbiodinium sp. CCMP2592]